jgi:hypothetical protein
MTQGFVNPYTYAVSAPTITTYTSGSGTYTVPSGVQYLVVELVGGGGGGGGGGTTGAGIGVTGGTTTFGSLSATGGGGGPASGNAGGWSASSPGIGSGGDVNAAGGTASPYFPGNASLGTATNGYAPAGGNSIYGGGGLGGANGGDTGKNATGFGGGGGGAGGTNVGGGITGTVGGSGGGYCRKVISNPSATYSYAVGAGGASGTVGTNGAAGGAGSAGIIIIYEYYQTLGIPTTLTLPLPISNGGTGTSVAPSTFYVNTANTTVNGLSVVKYSNVINDSASAYSTSTGLYTIPRAGWYIVNANIKFTNYNYGAGAITQMNIYQNSTVIASTLTTPTAYNSTAPALNAGTVYYFTAGDTVSVQGFGNLGGATTTLDNSVTNFLSINFLHS